MEVFEFLLLLFCKWEVSFIRVKEEFLFDGLIVVFECSLCKWKYVFDNNNNNNNMFFLFCKIKIEVSFDLVVMGEVVVFVFYESIDLDEGFRGMLIFRK